MRRQRYRAHLERDGELSTRMILAYNPQSVEDFYRRMGYIVLDVESARKRRTTERPNNPRWVLDNRAIREACEFLGLTLPVDIKPTNVAGGRHGAHCYTPVDASGRPIKYLRDLDRVAGFRHRITVKSWLDVEQASRTLWHELCHAMQAEQVAGELSPAAALQAWKVAYRDGRAYSRKPIEVEAREYEEFATEHPLARLA